MISNTLTQFTLARIGSLTIAILVTVAAGFSQVNESTGQNVSNDKAAGSVVTAEAKTDKSEAKPAKAGKDLVTETAGNESLKLAVANPYSTVKTERTSVPAKQTAGSGWEFAFAPYLYMTGLNGTIGARGAVTDVDISFGDVISNLDFGVMGTFQARKGKFVITNDLLWMKLGSERDTPGGLFSTVRVDVDMVIWDPEAGIRVYNSDKGSVDILGGFRLMSIENNVEFGTGTLPGFEVTQRKTWAMPVGGVHGLANLSDKLFISGKFDIGGWGDNFTTQIYAGGGYKIRPRLALIGGYRYMKTDYSDNTGFVFDTTMNGLIIGAKFSF